MGLVAAVFGSGQPSGARSAASRLRVFPALPASLERAGPLAALVGGAGSGAGRARRKTRGRRAGWQRGSVGGPHPGSHWGRREVVPRRWPPRGRGERQRLGETPHGVHLTAAAAPALKPQAARCILARLCGKWVQGTPPIAALKAPLLGVQLGKATLEGRWVDGKQQAPALGRLSLGIWRRPTSRSEADVNVGRFSEE